MRKKQCATRRLPGSEVDDDEGAELAEVRSDLLNVSPDGCSRPQANSEMLGLNDELEDGTVVVQPEPAADDREDAFSGLAGHNGGRMTHSSAPGIYDTVKCTACGKKVNPYNGTMQVHPLLKVLVCHKCFKYYDSGCFDVDQDGKENQCRWCGEGGSLICCDKCEHSFCRTCIKRNLGRSALQDIESLPDSEAWYCYACDQALLKDLQEEANIVMKAVRDHFRQVNRRSEKHKATAAKKATSHVQVPAPAAVQPANFLGLQLDLSSVPSLALKLPLQPAQPQRPVLVSSGNHSHSVAANGSRGNSAQMTEQWYKKNVKIESILADIESVDSQNIGVALHATVGLLQGMMRQYSRFIQDLAAAKTQNEQAQVVSRFKSAYRMHLFLRLGKLRSLIAEEERHTQRKPAGGKQQQQQQQQQQQPQQQKQQQHLPPYQQEQQQQPRPLPQMVGVIDLTDDSCGAGDAGVEQMPQLPLPAVGSIVDGTPNRAPPDTTSEVVVVLSDEEETQDSNSSVAGGNGAKKEKPPAILELLEQRRQREKARKPQQPRKITLPATNRRQSEDSVCQNGGSADHSPSATENELDTAVKDAGEVSMEADAEAPEAAEAEDSGGGLSSELRKRPRQHLESDSRDSEKRPRQQDTTGDQLDSQLSPVAAV